MVQETITVYGVIGGASSEGRTLVAPRDVIVDRVLVTLGQAVPAGAPLAVLSDTPAARAAYRDSVSQLAFAETAEGQAERLYAVHETTNDQLGAARKAVADARSALTAQTAMGAAGGSQVLRAGAAGVVAALSTAEGAHLAMGAPVMLLQPTDAMVADLKAQPPEAPRLTEGQAVRLSPVFDPKRTLDSRLSLVGRAIDPQTRFLRLLAPAAALGLPLGTAVQGVVTLASHPGLLAPQNAVVYDSAGAHVFLAQGGRAKQVAVKTGTPQGQDIEVSGTLTPGQALIVDGAYQVQDGMAVRTSRQ